MFRITPSLAMMLALMLGVDRCPATAATLVEDGKPVGVVALPPSPDDAETLAAKELIDHVEKMSGAKLPTVTVDPAGLDAFILSGYPHRDECTLVAEHVLPNL